MLLFTGKGKGICLESRYPCDSTCSGTGAIIKVSGHQYRWLAGGYDLEIGHFLEVASMVVTWWIGAFLHSAN